MSSFTRPALNGMCPLCPNQCTSSTRESHEQPMCILMFSVAANSGGALNYVFVGPSRASILAAVGSAWKPCCSWSQLRDEISLRLSPKRNRRELHCGRAAKKIERYRHVPSSSLKPLLILQCWKSPTWQCCCQRFLEARVTRNGNERFPSLPACIVAPADLHHVIGAACFLQAKCSAALQAPASLCKLHFKFSGQARGS